MPTGKELFWRGVGDLYRVENVTKETPNEEELAAWLERSSHEVIGYSDILELLAPDAATRRDYLAKHFAGVEPAPTHELLAELAVRGVVRVFVTTNFDQLLERALQARGIAPIVVTSDTDLGVLPSRELAECYIVKAHGDYLQQTIRNTPTELAELSPALTAELEEIFSRYGVVVVGYSGSDEAVTDAMLRRRSRYGMYWLGRGELAEPARSLAEQLQARTIVRPGAAEFLADLDRRLAVFAAHPTGETPIIVNDEVVLLLRRDDQIGLRELLRHERREYEDAVLAQVDGRHHEQPTEEIIVAVVDAAMPILERRLASLLPLALHSPDLLASEMDALAAFKNRQPRREGSVYVFWPGVLDWAAQWLGTVVGALLVEQGEFDALRPVFGPRVSNRYGTGTEPMVNSLPGESERMIGALLMKRLDPTTNYAAPPWEARRRQLPELAVVRERYPELVTGAEQPLRSLVEFDFVQSIALGVAGGSAVAHWAMYTEPANAFAARLHADPRLRERLARAVGLTLDEFDEKAPGALEAARHVTSFPEHGPIQTLRTGKSY